MTKNHYLLLLWLMLFPPLVPGLWAQQENIWVFGKYAGLDFSATNPVPIVTGIDGFGEANASVCDHNGTLLFYTEGSYIWDRNGNLMPNGSDLTPFTSSLPVTSSSCQGTVIVPYPGQEQLYFVFSLTDVEMGGNMGRLYYAIVDMNLNGGLGDVVTGSKGIFVDSMLTESVTATVGDRCNIWLITRSSIFQQFRMREITASGLNPVPVISPFGGNGTGGTVAVSPDRKKLASATSGSYGLWLYDFNAVSGTVSNPITLQPFAPCLGVAFSRDNTKLYTSRDGSVYQYDISSGNSITISNAEVMVGSTVSYTHLKLAENGKIYFHSSESSLGVINNPDLAGIACGMTSGVITLLNGTSVHGGLPNVVPVIPRDTFFNTQKIDAACFTSETIIEATNNAGWGYLWNTGNTGAGINVDSPGTYWVTYHTPPCVFRTDTIIVSFPNGVLPHVFTDTACIATANGNAYATTYAGDTVVYQYTWTTASGDTLSVTDTLHHVPAGNYTLHITTVNCDTTLAVVIPEADYKISFLTDTIICMGTAAIFQNTSGSHFTEFRWYFGDGDSSLSANPPAHPYLYPGLYEAMLTGNGSFCTDTARKKIIVDSLLPGAFLAEPGSICVGEDIRFLPQTGTTTISLNWQFGDGTEMTGPNELFLQHAYDKPGALAVTLTTQFRACPDAGFTDTIYVYDLPKVYLGPDTGLCLNGAPIYIRNQAEAPAVPHHYLWNTGDTTTTLKIVHPGSYSLTVSNEPLGCSATESITIKKDCYIDIPNAFTPNRDGVNDYFFPRQLMSKNVTRFRMQLFDRWGQLIFETDRADGRGWDGNFNGKAQPAGVYVYLIDVAIAGNIQEHYQGNVSLLR